MNSTEKLFQIVKTQSVYYLGCLMVPEVLCYTEIMGENSRPGETAKKF